MPPHTKVYGPVDPATPQGFTAFGVKINPKAFFDKTSPADYRVSIL